ncbi:PAS domain-containing protein [Bdellovibrio sp. ArHS]|uniref:PAS domain-containing protein n=1 Tax=Bdellovibrio sp. ArHS TaxID=1569284 RepID=UPI0025C649FA|nr:PAS domain-containing protein [Bdellovibrio sp. ArHS]
MEADFALEELFFSKTDFKGRIEAANKVFLRVSEYAEHEVMQKPHNIIRHADMPRSVFKLFWSFLQNRRPICAYVKNKSKSGRYYWVFAMAFPMQDGYLSIRLKPSTALLPEVQNIYNDLIQKEGAGEDLDTAVQTLLQALKDRGFNSYEEFMSHALLTEMKSRDQLLSSTENVLDINAVQGLLRTLLTSSRSCTVMAREAFRIADQLTERTRVLNSKSHGLADICSQVQMVTTNLTISAAKLGEAGKPLAVVSNNLEKLASEILSNSEDFEKTFAAFDRAASGMFIAIAIARFQVEMMNCLLEESLLTDKSASLEKEQEKILKQNCDLLKQLISTNFAEVQATAQKLIEENKSLIQCVAMLSKVTAGMDVICVVGKIEMARVKELSSSLEALLGDMEGLTEDFKQILRWIDGESKSGLHQSNRLRERLSVISQNLTAVESALGA